MCRLSKQTTYFVCMMLFGLCNWLIATHAVLAEVLSDNIGKDTVFTSAWVIGWGNVLITQVRNQSLYILLLFNV